jgi:multiple sugar transport system permease protein
MSTLRRRHPEFYYLLAAPTVVVVVLLTVYPSLAVFSNSLYEYDYIAGTRIFNGLDNYRSILSDSQFRQSVLNTTVFVALAATLETALGFLLALLYYEPFRGRRALANITVFPMMLSTMVVSATWRTLFHFDIGPINALLRSLGVGPVGWLINPDIALLSVVIVDIWQWTPFVMAVMVAGLLSLPVEPFDSAQVDGANTWQIFTRITLPMLRPITMLIVIMRALEILQTFDLIYVVTLGGPGSRTMTLSLLTYLIGFRYWNVGKASAVAWLLMIPLSILITIFVRVMERGERVEQAK